MKQDKIVLTQEELSSAIDQVMKEWNYHLQFTPSEEMPTLRELILVEMLALTVKEKS